MLNLKELLINTTGYSGYDNDTTVYVSRNDMDLIISFEENKGYHPVTIGELEEFLNSFLSLSQKMGLTSDCTADERLDFEVATMNDAYGYSNAVDFEGIVDVLDDDEIILTQLGDVVGWV